MKTQRTLLLGLVVVVAVGFGLLWFEVAGPGRALIGIGLLAIGLQATWWVIGWGLARVESSMTPKAHTPRRARKR